MIVLEAEHPTKQQGSTGEDRKAGASGGQVLGQNFGSKTGDFAEYSLTVAHPLEPAFIGIRYARAVAGQGRLRVEIDNQTVGFLTYEETGGWGDTPDQFRMAYVRLKRLEAGTHTLRLSIPADESPNAFPLAIVTSADESPLLRVGQRSDKNSVGHGRNIALYTGMPSRFFFATHELGNIFSATDGGTINWFPDHVRVSPIRIPAVVTNINLDQIVIQTTLPAGVSLPTDTTTSPAAVQEERDVCVTDKDVIVSRIYLTNSSSATVPVPLHIAGDCRGSFDWRGSKGGEKKTLSNPDGTVTLVDKNVFPEVMPDGLFMVVGGSQKPVQRDTQTPGVYRLDYTVEIPPHGETVVTLACAVDRDEQRAHKNLAATLALQDPIAVNRASWENYYKNEVPSFTCSDPKLTELYDFRLFLLQFSTAGGDLGLFRYPVVMEGRQAFQTYCCYSAPFMAFDRNWNTDPMVGWGHIANMVTVAYDDGRFPWYASPRTNNVPLDHPSKTGMSLLPWTLWRWYQIHGDKVLLGTLYAGMAKNVRWWIADRDPDGNGLFSIDHQLETGMDDLFRRWKTGKPKRYEAVDATVYAYLNLRAVANMARELGKTEDAHYFHRYADRTAKALETICWNPKEERFQDRNPETGEMADYDSICTFYPLLTDIVDKRNLGLIRHHLLNPQAYWTAHPIPALSQTDPDFDPVHGYWRGPSWPAATSHVIEGFATTAKRLDRSLLPAAAELFRRAAMNHLQPRADFYERYNPFDGRGLSSFRDYMHSWWIDIYIRHVAGLMIEDDGSITIDPLPLGLTSYALRNIPLRGHRLAVLFNDAKAGKGITVERDGTVIAHRPNFVPGGTPLHLHIMP
jgi:hypothetical protein